MPDRLEKNNNVKLLTDITEAHLLATSQCVMLNSETKGQNQEPCYRSYYGRTNSVGRNERVFRNETKINWRKFSQIKKCIMYSSKKQQTWKLFLFPV